MFLWNIEVRVFNVLLGDALGIVLVKVIRHASAMGFVWRGWIRRFLLLKRCVLITSALEKARASRGELNCDKSSMGLDFFVYRKSFYDSKTASPKARSNSAAFSRYMW
jgi:hypothetical protein